MALRFRQDLARQRQHRVVHHGALIFDSAQTGLLGILERSQETSGLPLVFLLKTLIPLFAAMMALQGVAQAIKAAHVLKDGR